ncbi:hypothetical protein [Candidatus Oleimmundimicrobium sp.]|uniref:GGDEF domain-containing protein n=1 Tax=Candidatus Oleimmundimicrobium sp. TaxID=3060597 RepID=UPI00272806B1|nr:hypothetical protein [Candidatus Oleimmundimicrobium sp.]MDO8885601.1 hypothetical protein [Candidatus Oleimmundimicrobium sp.]
MIDTPAKRYHNVSQLFLILGTIIAMLTSFILFYRGTTIEAYAQMLFIPIIAGAVYYGKKGGFIAAIGAGVVYILLLLFLVESQLAQVVTLTITLRIIFFCFMGIVGGLLFEKFKEQVMDLEEKVLVNEESGLYTARYFITVIQQEIDRATRYKSTFSIITFKFNLLKIGISKRAEKKLIKDLGEMFKQQTRIVDEIAYLSRGDFGVVLPEIDKKGAKIFLDRIKEKFIEIVKKKKKDFSESDLNIKMFTYQDNLSEIEKLISQYAEKIGVSHIKRPKEL